MTADSYEFHIEVKHHCSPPNRFTWEIRAMCGLAVEESRVQFGSWEEASHAGKQALERFSQRRYADDAPDRTIRHVLGRRRLTSQSDAAADVG